MKNAFFKKTLSLVCAAAMLVGSMAGLTTGASAAGASLGYWPEPLAIPNEYYYENQTLQPYGTCFQIDELKNWSPDNDPDARYNRGAIELRERWMGPNVNPLASRDAKVMPLAMGNARASQAPSQGGDGVSAYVFNNFQYVTNYNFWGGSSGEGPIAIPSPELIDSGHRNGVPVTGTIFLPWGDGAYGNQFVSEMVQKDENGRFPAADKLIEIAQYYGFDGYIFNAESGTGVAGFKEFLAYIQENKPDNFFITWYNGSGSLGTGSIKSWMQDGDTRITDEWWLDMSGSGHVDGTIEAAQQMGVDPWNIYSTWEYWPMSGMSGTKGGNYQARLDENGILKCSLGILAPTCTLTQAVDAEDFMNNQDQKMWVGPTYDPSSTYRPSSEFCGFASMVADKTPVIGTDFVTNFTAGNGYKFYENGEVVGKEDGWFNRSLTDVLPTWRWIIESEGEKLDAIIDYADAWYAGTSMKFSGNMDANKANHIKLYSAQLEITEQSKFSFTYKTPVAGVNVELGLCFGDTYDAENFKFYPVATTADGEWNTSTIDLSSDAGKTAIAISLRFTAPEGVSDYAINVGQMAFTTNTTAPEATSSVTLDEVIYPSDKTMEARIYWEKAEGAFMYRIFRVHADGTREFVGATPSDAFYLGSFEKDAGETACNFEIVSYSENCVKGETKSFSIAWPAEVENGFVPVFDEGPNLALKQPAISSVYCVADGPVHQINDGTVLNGSKWCSTASQGYAVIDLGENKTIQRWVVYHANCPGAGESVDMNTVNFDLQYAADDGGALLNANDTATVNRVKNLSYSVADVVTNNKQDITDRNLAEPITARYLKLNVTKNGNSAWGAIRIYEFEAYENPAINNTASPYERNVTVKNNAGATDTVVIDNVIMKYSSGTYSDKNGVFHEDTGKVRLFTSLDAEEPFAVVQATQPNESYKQRGVGIAKFENLELNAEGGRLFYDVLDGSGTEVVNSRRASVYYAPESGTASNAPTSVTLTRTTYGKQLRSQYGTFTATGLEEGAIIKIFDSATADSPILHTLPAVDGTITQSRVPLNKDGGAVYYEVHKEGKPDSERFALAYGDAMSLNADMAGLNQLIAKCDAISQADCTSATWTNFAAKLAAAKAVAAGTASAAAAETARAELAKAFAELRFKGNAQRLDELCKQYEAAHPEEVYTASSFAPFKTALTTAKEAIAADNSSRAEYEQMRIALEAGVRGLVVASEVTVTEVVVTPASAEVAPGGTKQFTAQVNGTGDPSQEVIWNLVGQESADTKVVDGLLTVGADEKVGNLLTIWVLSKIDSTKMTSVTVNVVEGTVEPTEPTDPVDPDVNVALGAEVIAYNGNNLGGSAGPEKLFDGKMSNPDTDKWCVNGKNMWVAFDIGQTLNFGSAVLYHAGANNEFTPAPGAINTAAYELYTLNTSVISVEELLAKTESERNTLLADNSYWTQIASRTDNKEDITTDEFDIQNARIFKINVSDTDSTNWGDCVRLYELELYATGSVDPVPEVSIRVEPAEMTVNSNPGQKGQFTAIVEGTDDVTVEWTISGNTSEGTMIGNGQLFLGEGETATEMIVTATSNADPTKSATAIVHVEKSPEHLFEEAREAAKKELEDYKAALLAENAYSENGEAALADALSAGIAALEAAGTEEALAAALAEAKAAMDAVLTAAEEGDIDAAVKAAQAAQKAAEEAAQRAEEAKAAAEAAQAAAEEAAASTAEDKAAAEAAAAEAEAAAKKAEEAIAAAEAAQAAAEAAAQAAEESNVAAALEAQKAAEEAAKSATSAAEAAQYAAEAAEAQQGAQEAREAAEAAQAAAEEAQRKAEEAQAAAEEAAASSAEDKEAAENAKKEAEAAKKAAEDAKKAAEDAEAAAKAAEESAAAHDAAAAQAAAEAARYAQEVAEKYEEICAMKAEMAKYLLDAQKYAEAAEEAKKKAEAAELNCAKYYAMFTLATYADKKDYAEAQQAELAAAIEAGTKAIEAAESIDAVNEALAGAKAAIDAIKTLADLEAEKLPFTDVTEQDWFFNAVKYAYQNGIMVGNTTTTFNPHGTLTRGQLVAMLYRMAGAPEVTEKSPFTDVPEGMYYADAIAWAYKNEVAYGKTATTFDPTAEVTREEMAAFLARFAKYQGVYEEADVKVLEKYEDAESIQAYAKEAIAWAVENGIMSGMSESVMAPRGTAKRCQAANLMMNYQLAFVDAE